MSSMDFYFWLAFFVFLAALVHIACGIYFLGSMLMVACAAIGISAYELEKRAR